MNEEKENILDQYDPRSVDDRNTMDVAMFTKKLLQLQPDTQAIDILEHDPIHQAAGSENVPGPCLAYSLKEQLENLSSAVSGNRTPTAAQFQEELGHFTPEVIKDIEHCTRGQAENPTWKAYRYGMLTASYFHRICKAVEKGSCPQSLLKSIMSKYDTDIHVPALEWGLKKEKVACDLYTRANRSVHKRVVVEKRGLYIMSDYPFIGCSVDGIFTCRCHGKKIIEIKCPYSLRHMHPREVAIQKGCVIIGNKSLVTEKSEYYHQMQGQMGIYGISCCDLVIYTEKGIRFTTRF